MLSATPIPINVKNAKRVIQCATLLLSALPLVVSHTPSALPAPVNANHVTQAKTKTAPKSRPLATKNASRSKPHHVELMENVHHAQLAQPTPDVSQPPPVRAPASHTHHHQRTTTSAHGTLPSHNALLVMEPRARPSANSNAKQYPSESATSRTTLASSVITTKTRTASRPWTSARLNNKKEDASQRSSTVSTE